MVLLLQLLLPQLLLLQPFYAVGNKHADSAGVTRTEKSRLPGAPGASHEALVALRGRRRGAGPLPADQAGTSVAAKKEATLETQTAGILARLSVAWASTWKPAVFAAAKKYKRVRKQAYNETAAAIDSYVEQQLERLGIVNSPAAEKKVKAAATSLKEAALILLSLPTSAECPVVSQRDTPPPDPTVYDDPVGTGTVSAVQQQQQQVKQLLLPPLFEPWDPPKVETSLSPANSAAGPPPHQQPKTNWAVATWQNAIQKVQQLMP